MSTQKQINPRLEELRLQQQQVLQRHSARVEELKDHLFFGMRFQTEQALQIATSILTKTCIALQCVSGAGCVYSFYRKRYIPGVAMAMLTELFGYPIKYMVKQNDFITKQLDTLERQTSSAMKKISSQVNAIRKQESSSSKGFFARVFGK